MREFLIDLYREHLEEASFLYDQCRHLRSDAEMAWSGLHAFEERLEAQLDALVIGGELALEVCRERVLEGDAGELFAALAVFCRQQRGDGLAEALSTLEAQDDQRGMATMDALKAELPARWVERALAAVAKAEMPLAGMLARTIGHRRIDGSNALAAGIVTAPRAIWPDYLWALGRCGKGDARRALAAVYYDDDEALAAIAVRAGLLLHDDAARGALLQRPTRGALLSALGQIGERDAIGTLLEAMAVETDAPHAVLGLGLLGELSAVRPLVEMLSSERLGPAAAEALFVITGAPIFETVTVVDAMSEDELLAREIKRHRQTGEWPMRSDGQAFGSTLQRLSQDPAAWGAWLASNARRFVLGERYRLGALCTPAVTLRGLLNDLLPKSYRAPLLEELIARHGIDLGLEADMPVAWQQRVLEQALLRAGAAA